MLASSTKSTSTLRRFFFALEVDSSSTLPARPQSLATRRSFRASALHTCATQYERRSPTAPVSRPAVSFVSMRRSRVEEVLRAGGAECGEALLPGAGDVGGGLLALKGSAELVGAGQAVEEG